MVLVLVLILILPNKHNLSNEIIANAIVAISKSNFWQSTRVAFFKFLIFDNVNDGGKFECVSLNCSFKSSFKALSVTKSIIELIIGPVVAFFSNYW